jgi:hypothetical protein
MFRCMETRWQFPSNGRVLRVQRELFKFRRSKYINSIGRVITLHDIKYLSYKLIPGSSSIMQTVSYAASVQNSGNYGRIFEQK